MSLKDLSSRRPRRDRALPRWLLSMRLSTASCNMRFSLRMITSGAPSSSNLFKRLLRLITRRYRSLRSEVAKRPPSNCTIGRRSGGMTGRTVRIIHAGLLPERRNASTTFKRVVDFLRFCLLLVVRTSCHSSSESLSRSRRSRMSKKASAPISARKTCPQRCLSSR